MTVLVLDTSATTYGRVDARRVADDPPIGIRYASLRALAVTPS